MSRQKADEGLQITFDVRAVRNKARSDGETIRDNENNVVEETKGSGRDEFDNIPYVKIEIPGDKDSVADRPVRFCLAETEGHLEKRLAILADPKAWASKCRAPVDSRGKPRLDECDVHRFHDDWLAFRGGVAGQSGDPLKAWTELDPATVAELAYHNVHTVQQLALLTDSNATKFFALRTKARELLEAKKQANDKDKQIDALTARLAALEAKAAPAGKPKAA